jgi:hypothetical protein
MFDPMVVALISGGLDGVEAALVLAIHYRQQKAGGGDTQARLEPVATAIEDFVHATRYAGSTVKAALARLERRHIITVGHRRGRGNANLYGVAPPDGWQAMPARKGPVARPQKRAGAPADLGQENSRYSNSEVASPLPNPLEKEKKKEKST